MADNVLPPKKPEGLHQVKVINEPTRNFIVAGPSYSGAIGKKTLATTNDEVEVEVSLKQYETMENDPVITKVKKIIITNVLSDEMQLAPRRTEAQVGQDEYKIYLKIMDFCQRIADGLDRPYRETAEQILGNGVGHGHGIAEIEWGYRLDEDVERPEDPRLLKAKKVGFFSRAISYFYAAEEAPPETKKTLFGKNKTRLLPKSIKVKPRGAARFVVDDYMNILGLAPRITLGTQLRYDQIIDRNKFMILTLNKRDEDPRGKSSYRPAFNWYNLKSQLPSELLRFILEESVPKAVATLPENAAPYEVERDEKGNIVYEDDAQTQPKMITAAESMKRAIESYRSGSGIVIPHGATMKPYKTGLTGSTDAMLFSVIIKIIDDQIENAILLQTLAQSEGEHQARSASQQVAELLNNLVFWIKRLMAVMTQKDLFETAVVYNFGEWARKYVPQVSFGDFVRRDWGADLTTLANAYDKKFLDDTQRAELMQWLNLPPPGPSERELGLDQSQQQPPAPPDKNRGTEKPIK